MPKTDKKKRNIGCISGIIILIVIGVTVSSVSDFFSERSEEKERAEKQKITVELAQKQGDEFLKNIDQHYHNLITGYNENIQRALNELKLFDKYAKLDYKDVAEYKRKIGINQLEIKAQSIPSSNASKNLNIYKQLLSLDPANPKYKQKIVFYTDKLNQQRLQKQKEKRVYEKRIAKFGKPPINSAWDGSVSCVKRYLKEIAKDPDSLKFEKWGKIMHNDEDGWLVWCQYRGKNSFGGYVRNTNWFVIRHDRIIAIKELDAYR
ncbi:hypothetical protein KAW18_14815 [candidate division WOR-3 bacterium]|nr:hypothetical protein [candidate division WOR-3 bacterium]